MSILKKGTAILAISVLVLSMCGGVVTAAPKTTVIGSNSEFTKSAIVVGANSGSNSQTYVAGNYTVMFSVSWVFNGTSFTTKNISATRISGWSMSDINYPSANLTDLYTPTSSTKTFQMNAVAYTSFRGGFLNMQHEMPYVGFNCNALTGLTTPFYSNLANWIDSNYKSEWPKLKDKADVLTT